MGLAASRNQARFQRVRSGWNGKQTS